MLVFNFATSSRCQFISKASNFTTLIFVSIFFWFC